MLQGISIQYTIYLYAAEEGERSLRPEEAAKRKPAAAVRRVRLYPARVEVNQTECTERENHDVNHSTPRYPVDLLHEHQLYYVLITQ